MKNLIELKKNKFFINSKPFFIYSGEIHYFRVEESILESIIKKAKKAKLNTISSYIPWRVHEKNFNEYNFEKLLLFLKLIKKHNLYFIARVGPVCHGEMTNDGLPDWLFDRYPEIRLARYDGTTNPYSSMIDYSSEIFFEQVKRWYSNLLPIISENQITKSGPIILIQLDNEISMINWLSRTPNYSKSNTKKFQEYLKEKYKNISNLNSYYKKNYTDFSEIEQPFEETNTENLAFHLDFSFYYRKYYAEYYSKLYNEAKKYDIEISFLANIPQVLDYSYCGRGLQGLMTTLMFRDFKNYVPEVIFGGAYQFRHIDYENFHDIHLMTECVKMITSPGLPVICAEMQTGALTDRTKIYPQDVELNIKTSIASGLAGFNCYMFAAGVNKDSLGGFGTYHEWQAPIDSKGYEREHFKTLCNIGEIIHYWNNLIADTFKVYDTAIGFYAPYYATEYLYGKFIDDIINKRDNYFFDGIARLLSIANYSYKLIDLQSITLADLNKEKTLFVFALEFMDSETQRKLFEYVNSGGNLFIYPAIPVKEINFSDERFLLNSFGINSIEKEPQNINLYYFKYLGDQFEIFGGNEIYTFEGKNIEKIAITKNNKVCGFIKNLGKGKLIVAGFSLQYLFDYQIRIIEIIANLLGIKKSVDVEPLEISAILRKGEKSNFLIVSNYHLTEKKCKIKLNDFNLTLNLKLKPKSSLILPVYTEIDKDFKIFYSNTEFIIKGNKIILNNFAGDEIEMMFLTNNIKEIRVKNRKSIVFKNKNGRIAVKFKTSQNREELLF